MVTGRNDPCPCGSGRKFKKCCLEKSKSLERLGTAPLLPPDSIDLKMREMLAGRSREEFDASRKGLVETLRARFEREATGLEPDSSASEQKVLEYIESLEAAARGVLQRHSWYFWLMLSRRIGPEPGAYAGRRLSSVNIARDIMTKLIYKHGRERVGDEIRETDKGTMPAALHYEDVVGIYQVDYVSGELALSAAAFRRLGKGGRLSLPRGEHWNVELPAEVERFTSLFDDRVERYTGMLAEFGFPRKQEELDSMWRTLFEWKASTAAALSAAYNVWRTPVSLDGMGVEGWKGVTFLSNFVIVALPLEELYEKLKWFEDELQEVVHLGAEEIVGFVAALSKTALRQIAEMPQYFLQMMTTGYRGMVAAYTEQLARAYADVMETRFGRRIDELRALREVEQLAEQFTFSSRDLAELSAAFDQPARFIMREERYRLVDLSLLARALSALPQEITDTGPVGQIRGKRAEREMFEAVREGVTGVSEAEGFWTPGFKVKNRLGAEIGEVDGAIRCGDTLFVLEMKSMRMHGDVWRGKRRVVERREEQLRSYLVKHDMKCEEIARRGAGLEGVRYIVPIICTPFPEYVSKRVSETGRDLFLTSEVPRMCVPTEAITFIRSFRFDGVRGKSFLYEVTA